LPDAQYQRAVPYLQGYPNVTLVGYVKTLYGKRMLEDSQNDVNIYWHWDELSRSKNIGAMGLDGIFVDEVDCEGENLEYFEALCQHIKAKTWSSGNPGTSYSLLFDKGYVILNPGCAPTHPGYYRLADLVIVFEHHHQSLVSPPLDSPEFQYLSKVGQNHGLKLMLPQPSRATMPKFGVMIHNLLPGQTREAKLTEMHMLVHDLVQVKRVGTLFITDVQIEDADVYANWSSVWQEFIGMVAEATKLNSFLY